MNGHSRLLLAATMGLAVPLGLATAATAEQKPYQIALSNSYIGNQWRVEMINLAKAYAEHSMKGRVVLSVTSSGTDVQRQIAAIDDMISRGVDAILVNPASESGLNPVIAQATQRGIIVVDFDHAVSAPSAYKVHVDFVKFGEIQAQWLADTLQDKDIVVGIPTLTTEELKPGVNVFPDLPATVYDDIDIPGSGISLTMQDALGK